MVLYLSENLRLEKESCVPDLLPEQGRPPQQLPRFSIEVEYSISTACLEVHRDAVPQVRSTWVCSQVSYIV